jgi:hypothetical protein
LKNVKTPKQRIFFRCAALKILEIRQDSCEFLPCPAKKSLAVGHSAIYQTSPNSEHTILYPQQTRGAGCGPSPVFLVLWQESQRMNQETPKQFLNGYDAEGGGTMTSRRPQSSFCSKNPVPCIA